TTVNRPDFPPTIETLTPWKRILDTPLATDIIVDTGFSTFSRHALTGRREEYYSMSVNRRLNVSEVGEVTVVRFVDRRILDEANIQEMGQELFQIVEDQGKKQLLLNFSGVEFLSSAALGKLITLDKRVKAHSGKLMLSNIRPEIYEVFKITRLNTTLDIKDDEADALAAFAALQAT
ncbi:MAG: STAS domain-containing protein, partial [Pirellulales bacterium]